MFKKNATLLGAGGLLLAAGAATASHTYASGSGASSRASTQTIKAVEVNSKYLFNPVRDTVKAGSRVRWVNKTDAPHTVTFSKTGMLDKQLAVGKIVTFTPKSPGVYKYRCTYHAGMVGTLVVTK